MIAKFIRKLSLLSEFFFRYSSHFDFKFVAFDSSFSHDCVVDLFLRIQSLRLVLVMKFLFLFWNCEIIFFPKFVFYLQHSLEFIIALVLWLHLFITWRICSEFSVITAIDVCSSKRKFFWLLALWSIELRRLFFSFTTHPSELRPILKLF